MRGMQTARENILLTEGNGTTYTIFPWSYFSRFSGHEVRSFLFQAMTRNHCSKEVSSSLNYSSHKNMYQNTSFFSIEILNTFSLQHKKITNREFQSLAELSPRQALRDLQELVEQGLIEKVGKGRSVHYKLKPSGS